MKNHKYKRTSLLRGLSFLELTIVILVIMALLGILFVGVRAWRIGSDRSACIINQRSMQMAARSYQNLYALRKGPLPNGGNLADALRAGEFINDYLHQAATGATACPGGGKYLIDDPTSFPDDGELFMKCSLADSHKHTPGDVSDW